MVKSPCPQELPRLLHTQALLSPHHGETAKVIQIGESDGVVSGKL